MKRYRDELEICRDLLFSLNGYDLIVTKVANKTNIEYTKAIRLLNKMLELDWVKFKMGPKPNRGSNSKSETKYFTITQKGRERLLILERIYQEWIVGIAN